MVYNAIYSVKFCKAFSITNKDSNYDINSGSAIYSVKFKK